MNNYDALIESALDGIEVLFRYDKMNRCLLIESDWREGDKRLKCVSAVSKRELDCLNVDLISLYIDSNRKKINKTRKPDVYFSKPEPEAQ